MTKASENKKIEKRRDDALRRALNTPPKPKATKKKKSGGSPARLEAKFVTAVSKPKKSQKEKRKK